MEYPFSWKTKYRTSFMIGRVALVLLSPSAKTIMIDIRMLRNCCDPREKLKNTKQILAF